MHSAMENPCLPGNLDLEANDLRTHVVVCAERYNEITRRIASLERWIKGGVFILLTGVVAFIFNALSTHIH